LGKALRRLLKTRGKTGEKMPPVLATERLITLLGEDGRGVRSENGRGSPSLDRKKLKNIGEVNV